MTGTGAMVRTVDLRKDYTARRGVFGRTRGVVEALRGVSLAIPKGETLALVGESGSGKSTFGRLLVRLEKPTSGEIWFEGRNIADARETDLLEWRRRMQIIFQDPYGSLNPRITAGGAIAEVLRVHRLAPRGRIRRRVLELLRKVDLGEDAFARYPHEFSGGQRQRIGIARAIATEPRFLVADEPVSALDVSVQAHILRLLARLQDEMNLTILLITHNLALVEQTAHRVAVLYGGLLQEEGPTRELFDRPLHPYTKMLLDAVPSLDGAKKKGDRALLPAEPAVAATNPAGCPLQERCPKATSECFRVRPVPRRTPGGRSVACLNVPVPLDDP